MNENLSDGCWNCNNLLFKGCRVRGKEYGGNGKTRKEVREEAKKQIREKNTLQGSTCGKRSSGIIFIFR